MSNELEYYAERLFLKLQVANKCNAEPAIQKGIILGILAEAAFAASVDSKIRAEAAKICGVE